MYQICFKEEHNSPFPYFPTCVSVSGEAGVGGEGAPGGGGVHHLHDGVGVQAGRGPARHGAAAWGQTRPGAARPTQSGQRRCLDSEHIWCFCWIMMQNMLNGKVNCVGFPS